MPRAADAVADNETLGERTMVVGAMGGDREYFSRALDEQNLLVADMADQLPVGEICKPGTLRQIRASR